MESKALERLGILKPKRTFGQVIRTFIRRVIALGILGVCVWGGIRFYNSRSIGASDVKAVSKDDGSLYICEHLSVSKVTQNDLQTKEVGGRMVATERQYWFKLTIDERWYFKKFVPQVKRYLSEIAPGVETEAVTLDTKDLAYANDGADRLQKEFGTTLNGDFFSWRDLRMAATKLRAGPGKHPVLIFDKVKDNGALTLATLYMLNKAQFEKFENWVSQNVIRNRTNISAVLTYNGLEVASGSWPTTDIRPISQIHRSIQCYALSPWANVMLGNRCKFLGIRCYNNEGLLDGVEAQWNL